VDESELDAVELIAALAAEGPLTIIAIGPLTNLAHLLVREPEVVANVERVVIMGGASWHGNVTPAAEFNIWVDPEAARDVFAAAWPMTILPLDLTHQAYLTDDDLAYLRDLDTEVGRRVADMLEPYADYHEQWYLNRDLIMHDAMAVYEVIDPAAIAKQGVAVEVETQGEHSRGATWFHRSHHHVQSHVRVGINVDNERFVGILRERLSMYR
jgi:purine nucleosidase